MQEQGGPNRVIVIDAGGYAPVGGGIGGIVSIRDPIGIVSVEELPIEVPGKLDRRAERMVELDGPIRRVLPSQVSGNNVIVREAARHVRQRKHLLNGAG